MKKTKYLALLIVALLIPMTVFADRDYVEVDSDAISVSEKNDLNKKIGALVKKHNYELYINLCEDCVIENQIIDGVKADSVTLLLIDTKNKTWEFSSTRSGLNRFDAKAQNDIMNEVRDLLQNEDYYHALDRIIELSSQSIKAPEKKEKVWFSIPRLIGVVVVSSLIALLMAQSHKSKLKSFAKRRTAHSYLKDFKIESQEDQFVEEKVVRVKKDAEPKKGSSGEF